MSDLFDKCKTYVKTQKMIPLTEVDEETYYFGVNKVLWGEGPVDNGGPVVSSGDRTWLQFASNDYLGLSRNKDVREFASRFVKEHGLGSPMGSRALTGTTHLHLQLEEEVARFKKTEAALTFSGGANAMCGTVASLCSKDDMVILDKFAHSSLQVGAQLSGAVIKRFNHNDLNELEDILKMAPPRQAKLIVVDGVYSMQGTIAPLWDICDLKEKYNARLLVDDAHGNGVFGETGGGVSELLGLEDRIDIHGGTFSKAFGNSGGFIAGDKQVIAYLKVTAFTNIFTKAQPAVFVASLLKIIDIVRNGKELRKQLMDNTNYLQNQLVDLGFDIGDTVSPITPVIFSGISAIFLAHELREKHGLWVAPIVYPAVPSGSSIVRLIPTSLHTKEHIDILCDRLSMISSGVLPTTEEGVSYEEALTL
ncbi:MAG: aminotransferase class I/II-fold pyridoxal phosphate-dependent enzyme [bacterium]|nr:aminotransferase class I/II-fold pyridoxal phosphate-dependent enzyme [bacterium]